MAGSPRMEEPMWAKPTGPGPRTRACGSPAAWEGQEPASQGAWETLSLLGLWQGWEVRATGGFVPHTIAAALLDKGANKGAFGSGHTAQHPGRPQEASSCRPPTQAFPSSPPPPPPCHGGGQLGPSHAGPGQLCWELMKAERTHTLLAWGGPEEPPAGAGGGAKILLAYSQESERNG